MGDAADRSFAPDINGRSAACGDLVPISSRAESAASTRCTRGAFGKVPIFYSAHVLHLLKSE